MPIDIIIILILCNLKNLVEIALSEFIVNHVIEMTSSKTSANKDAAEENAPDPTYGPSIRTMNRIMKRKGVILKYLQEMANKEDKVEINFYRNDPKSGTLIYEIDGIDSETIKKANIEKKFRGCSVTYRNNDVAGKTISYLTIDMSDPNFIRKCTMVGIVLSIIALLVWCFDVTIQADTVS